MTHRLSRLAGILIVLATAIHPAAAQSPDLKTDRLVDGIEIVTGSYKTLRTLKDQANVKTEVKKDEV